MSGAAINEHHSKESCFGRIYILRANSLLFVFAR